MISGVCAHRAFSMYRGRSSSSLSSDSAISILLYGPRARSGCATSIGQGLMFTPHSSASHELVSSSSGFRAYTSLIPNPKWVGRLVSIAFSSSVMMSLSSGGALVLGAFPVGDGGIFSWVFSPCPASFLRCAPFPRGLAIPCSFCALSFVSWSIFFLYSSSVFAGRSFLFVFPFSVFPPHSPFLSLQSLLNLFFCF